jgi:hypothetical protein
MEMENKKFEQLIDLIINEDEEQAKELFHDIVVAKSKEIYESIMEDENADADDLEEGMGGQVGDLADEIQAEQSGIAEDEDEIEMDSEEIFDIQGDDEVDATLDIEANSSDEVEDAVVRIEDKLDTLLDEFEAIMSGEEDLEGRDDEMDADLHDIEGEIADQEVDVDVNVDDEELVAEAISLQKVTAKMGDNGEQTRSPVDANSGQKGMNARPVDFDKGNAGEQGRPAPKAKDVDGSSNWQNQPGKNAKKQSSAPKPVTAQASGTNTKSVID